MHQHWFYGQEGHKLGPFNPQQLRELAVAGKILLTDTVWKEGIERGVLATRVKNLFPFPALLPLTNDIAATSSQPDALEPCPPGGQSTATIPEDSPEQAVEAVAAAEDSSAHTNRPTSNQPRVEKKPIRKSRAMAIKGAKITGQDGTSVQFRKICTTCGHEDPSRTTMPIRTGMTRMAFYCRKCRKSREVEIQGLC